MNVCKLKMSEFSIKYIFSSFDVSIRSIMNIIQLNRKRISLSD